MGYNIWSRSTPGIAESTRPFSHDQMGPTELKFSVVGKMGLKFYRTGHQTSFLQQDIYVKVSKGGLAFTLGPRRLAIGAQAMRPFASLV